MSAEGEGQKMARVHKIKTEGRCIHLAFHCPGCGHAHVVYTGGCPDKPDWSWDRSMDAPTFHPSIRVQGRYHCHSFVENGQIRFLKDCNHDLAGQTVEVPEWEQECP